MIFKISQWKVMFGSALFAAAAFLLISCTSESKLPQLNILLITLDTTRADHLGMYGCENPTSFHLDNLAAESAVFDLAISQASVTPVSHASMFTGLEPYHHGLRVLHGLTANNLGEERITLAELWRDAGGETAAFVSAYPAGSSFGLAQGFNHFDEQFSQSDGEGLVTEKGTVQTGMSQRRADDTTHAAVEWLRANTPGEKPIFMWVHYFDPHDPLVVPPDEFVQALLNSKIQPASDEKPDVMRALYDCEIYYMDQQINTLLSAFKVRGLWNQTIVAVVGDHGEGLGDHNWWTHGLLYQEQIHVPFFIRIPGMESGKRIKSMVRTTDLAPTLLESAGLIPETNPVFDGKSLINAIEQGETNPPRSAYCESVNILRYPRHDTTDYKDEKDDKLYCIIDGNNKLIYHQLYPENHEFYDIGKDPEEMNNLAVEHHPVEMKLLMKRLEDLQVFSEIMPGMTKSESDRARKLKNLGYIE